MSGTLCNKYLYAESANLVLRMRVCSETVRIAGAFEELYNNSFLEEMISFKYEYLYVEGVSLILN